MWFTSLRNGLFLEAAVYASTAEPTGRVRPDLVWGAGTVWAALFVLLILVDVWKAVTVLPIPDFDARYFYPIYLSVAQHAGLENPFLSPIAHGGGPLTWHGWLQPMLLGYSTMLFGGAMTGALMSESVLKFAGLFIYFAWMKRLREGTKLPAILGLIVVYVALSAAQGRPELLASVLLLYWGFIDHWCATPGARTATAGVALSLLAVTQPTVAALSSVFWLLVLLRDQPLADVAKHWIATNTIALIGLLLLSTLLYPYSLIDWISGLSRQATSVATNEVEGDFLKLWFLNQSKPLQGVIIIAAAIVLGANVVRRDSWITIAAYSAAMFSLWYMSARNPHLVYNASAFIPLAVALGVTKLPDLTTSARRWLLICGYGTALASLLAIVGSFNSLRGPSHTALHQRLQKIDQATERRIILSAPLLIGAVPFEKWSRYDIGDVWERCPATPNTFVVVQQANSGSFQAPNLAGCRLIEDNFAERASLFGRRSPVDLVPRSYGFALYETTPSAPASMEHGRLSKP